MRLDGVSCLARTMVEFHANGRLKSCVLASNQQLKGVLYKKGLRIKRDASGRVCSLSQPRP